MVHVIPRLEGTVGFLRRLVGGSHPGQRPGRDSRFTLVDGDVPLEVVGESFHQDALRRIAGPSSGNTRVAVNAALVPEFDNPHDANAVAVWVQGYEVGHLSREEAALLRGGLLGLQQKAGTWIALQGTIVGGGPTDNLGLFLRFDPQPFGVTLPSAAAARQDHHIRTGLTEALDMNADDRFDLDWVAQRPDNPAQAVSALASRLASERNLVSRHFLYADFEKHLYSLRDAHPDALARFDEACANHDSEMGAIRPALIAMFHGLPLLEVYRQAAIRHQKAHSWDLAIDWARRGLAVYGQDALDPSNVTDLSDRVAKCSAKLEADRNPRPVGASREQDRRAAADVEAERREAGLCPVCEAPVEKTPGRRGRPPVRCELHRHTAAGES